MSSWLSEDIVTDQDLVFMRNFWLELFKAMGTNLKFGLAYYSQTDRQTEVINRSLEDYLCCFCLGQPKKWVKWLIRLNIGIKQLFKVLQG